MGAMRSIQRKAKDATSADNKEELLLKQATEKRVAREERCVKAVNEVLAKHKCSLQVYAHLGDQKAPIATVLAIPTSIGINSLR